jgi:hypothetical protein
MVQLWTAYLEAKGGREAEARALVGAAAKESAAFVFPYRDEDEPVLRWAAGATTSWKIPYYRALLHWSRGRTDLAREEFAACGDAPDLPAFYLARASFMQVTGGATAAAANAVEADLRRAATIGAEDWRTHMALTEFFALHGRVDEARRAAKAGADRFPANYALHLALARTLVLLNDQPGARAILDTLSILPFEGAKYGREAYRFVYVMSALGALQQGKLADVHALLTKAREWPERLGAGKPYDTDERVEDLIEAIAYERSGDTKNAQECRRRIAAYSQAHADADRVQHVIGVLVLRAEGKKDGAAALLKSWLPHGAQSAIQKWASAFLGGNGKELRAIEAAAPREMDRWSGDPDFLVVRNTLQELDIH